MHEAGIYSTEPGNQEVEELVEGLIQYLRVTCNRGQRGLLAHKLTWYINQCTQEWNGKGFLKQTSVDDFARSSIFEEMWKERRDAWLHSEVPSSIVTDVSHAKFPWSKAATIEIWFPHLLGSRFLSTSLGCCFLKMFYVQAPIFSTLQILPPSKLASSGRRKILLKAWSNFVSCRFANSLQYGTKSD
jgi:hypothetical protein